MKSIITSNFSDFLQAYLSKKRKRGSYRCGRCGQLKRGHVCNDVFDGSIQFSFEPVSQYSRELGLGASNDLLLKVDELLRENQVLRFEVDRLRRERNVATIDTNRKSDSIDELDQNSHVIHLETKFCSPQYSLKAIKSAENLKRQKNDDEPVDFYEKNLNTSDVYLQAEINHDVHFKKGYLETVKKSDRRTSTFSSLIEPLHSPGFDRIDEENWRSEWIYTSK